MTNDEFKQKLNDYAKEKENSMADLLIQVEKLSMDKLLYLQHLIAQTIVFYNVERLINIEKANKDVKELV